METFQETQIQTSPIEATTQTPIPASTVQNSNIDMIHDFSSLGKNYVKKLLNDYTQKPINIGSSFLKIVKASEKWVVVTESRNNLVQEHRRCTMANILQYIQYKKALFLKDSNENPNEIDPATQSKQYQNQHNNFLEVKQDFETHLEVIFKNYTKLINFTIDEENQCITIKINHDQTITLQLPNVLENGMINEIINISTNQTDISNLANNAGKFKFLKGYFHITQLLYEPSKESIHFITTVKKLISFKRQLKLLVSFVSTEIKDTSSTNNEIQIKDQIKAFIRNCKKGQTIEFEYEDFDANGKLHKRIFLIDKITKIRTVARVISTMIDEPHTKIIEFNRTFTKISQDLDNITNEMYNLYVANK